MTAKLPRVVLADLARSGLTATDARRLAIEYLPDFAPPSAPTGVTVRAYRLPYFDIRSRVNGFARERLLDPYTPPRGRKPAKYLQAPGTEPRLYLPPFLDWRKVSRDPKVPIYLVEGEKKAAALGKAKLAAVGLGGVWAWLSREDRGGPSESIEDFGLIEWRGRTAYLVFDSDIVHKRGVQQALAALRTELIKRGASPYEVTLPTLRGLPKVGADDFLVRKGKKAFLALPCRSLFVPEGVTAMDLLEKKLSTPRFVVPGLIAQGITVLAGAPKIGKSWLALGVSLAVASGTRALGVYEAGPRTEVLYLALEDTLPRLQRRLRQLAAKGIAITDRLHLRTEWPRVEQSGVEALDRFLDEHLACRLVFVDTLARLRATRTDRADLYFHEYDAIAALKRIADQHRAAIVLIHHLRKATADDPYERISGSTGITGAADTNIVLTRGRNDTDGELCVTGRDVEEQELALKFEGGTWTVLGPAAEYRVTRAQRAVMDALRAAGKPLSPSDVALRINTGRSNAYKRLALLVEDGLVREVGDGQYVLAEAVEGSKQGKQENQ